MIWLYSLYQGVIILSQIFDAYHKFELDNVPVTRVTLPMYIKSLDTSNIPSGSIVLNCAVATGIVSEFLQDEDIIPNVLF